MLIRKRRRRSAVKNQIAGTNERLDRVLGMLVEATKSSCRGGAASRRPPASDYPYLPLGWDEVTRDGWGRGLWTTGGRSLEVEVLLDCFCGRPFVIATTLCVKAGIFYRFELSGIHFIPLHRYPPSIATF
jgi:hypothetical protein